MRNELTECFDSIVHSRFNIVACKMNPCSICAGFSTLCFDCKCYNKLTFHRVNNNKNENISVFSLYYYLATDYGFSMWCARAHGK